MHGEEASRRARATLSTPFATVLPMSCSFMSRNTCLPARTSVSANGKPAREGKLIADLVERDRVAEPLDHRSASRTDGQVERDDQAVTCGPYLRYQM